MVSDIRRITDRFDNDGLPFYLVTSTPSILVDPSSNNIQP